jgi:hypothetical protein
MCRWTCLSPLHFIEQFDTRRADASAHEVCEGEHPPTSSNWGIRDASVSPKQTLHCHPGLHDRSPAVLPRSAIRPMNLPRRRSRNRSRTVGSIDNITADESARLRCTIEEVLNEIGPDDREILDGLREHLHRMLAALTRAEVLRPVAPTTSVSAGVDDVRAWHP